jgi:hypothetical protein
MSFEFNILTAAGVNLIAQATSSNPIVLSGCLSSPDAASSAEDLAAKDRSFYTGKSGNIFAASAQDNVARIIMSFNNQNIQNSQLIKSACVLGRLQSQNDSDAVIMAAISDSNSQITIPDSTAPLISIHIPINIAINADDNVATVGAEYASTADLERFVSTHKAGDPTQGDNQEIFGEKTFDNTIYSLSGMNPAIVQRYENTDNISFGGGAYYRNSAYQTPIDFLSTGLEISAAPTKHIMWTGGGQSSETSATYSFYFNSMMDTGGGTYTSFTTIRSDIQKTSANELGAVILEAKESTNSANSTLEISTNKSFGGDIYSRIYGKSSNVLFDSTQFWIKSSPTPGQSSNVARAEILSEVDTSGLFDKGFIQLTCYDSENTGTSINFTALSIDEQDPSNNIYAIYPVRLGGDYDHTVNIGAPTAKFNHVYADEFHGVADNAAKATNDINNNAIASYIRGIDSTNTTGSHIVLKTGGESSSIPIGIYLNSAVSYSVQGKHDSLDTTAYTRIGGIGLFAYMGSSIVEGEPGMQIPGSDLYTAGITNYTQDGLQIGTSSTSMSGTWVLLSYFDLRNGHAGVPLVLAVKVSTT